MAGTSALDTFHANIGCKRLGTFGPYWFVGLTESPEKSQSLMAAIITEIEVLLVTINDTAAKIAVLYVGLKDNIKECYFLATLVASQNRLGWNRGLHTSNPVSIMA
jgi:hypothetical protein